MVEVITKGVRDNVVALVAHGNVSHDDYRKVIIPAVEKKLTAHPRIRLLYHLGADFNAYSLEAIWDDTKLGVQHLREFEKVAVVTDVDWVKNSVSFFRLLIPCPVRLFRNNELAAATEWINA